MSLQLTKNKRPKKLNTSLGKFIAQVFFLSSKFIFKLKPKPKTNDESLHCLNANDLKLAKKTQPFYLYP